MCMADKFPESLPGFNLTIVDGKFAQCYENSECCPIAAWVIGEPVHPELDRGGNYNAAGKACEQFTRETGINGQQFWRDFDKACDGGRGSDGFAAEVAKLLGLAR